MSDICKNWSEWLKMTRFSYMTDEQIVQTVNWLGLVRDAILENAQIKENDTILDIGTGLGLLGFGALERISQDGLVIFSDKFKDCLDNCQDFITQNNIQKNYKLLLSPCENIDLPSNSIDKALMRSVLVHIPNKQPAINEIFRILKKDGLFCAFEPIIKTNTKYFELTSADDIDDYEAFKQAEQAFMSDAENPLVNFDEYTLKENLKYAGFTKTDLNLQVAESKYIVAPNAVNSWFASSPSPGTKTMKENFLKYFDEEKVNHYISQVDKALTGKEVVIKSNTLFITAQK